MHCRQDSRLNWRMGRVGYMRIRRQWNGRLSGPLKNRSERAGRDPDQDGFFNCRLVEKCKALPHFGNSQAHDRVSVRVVIGLSIENARSDNPLLERIELAGQSLVDNVLKQMLGLLAGAKGSAFQDRRQGFSDFGGRDNLRGFLPVMRAYFAN